MGVQAERLSYRYPQHGRGLVDLSLSVAAGEAWLVTGPSGCGKSTLARCLTGLIPHLYHGTLEGQVRLGGLDTAQTPLWQLSEQGGLVFQNPAAQMLAHSVADEIVFGLENLGLPRAEVSERLEEALARFELEPLRRRAPQTLSGGEQQKLALAAVMARRPPVLVMDEPLSMLDGRAAADLVAHLSTLASEGTSLVMCEHREAYLRGIPGMRVFSLGSADTAPPGRAPTAHAMAAGIAPVGALEVAVRDLSVSLGGRLVLQRLDLALSGGQVVALVGRNGAGKTTLLRALAGTQPHSGEVLANGRTADLGLVFQNADLQLFNATVRDEILFRVPDPDEARLAWLLEALGLRRYESTPPLLLSEGEKKRVALATVLMRAPRDGVLLDEPSLGQDEAHKAMLLGLCRAVADTGRVVLISTHDLSLAARADRLLLLGPEGIVADGPPGRVLGDAAAWARIGLPVPGPAEEIPSPARRAGVPGGEGLADGAPVDGADADEGLTDGAPVDGALRCERRHRDLQVAEPRTTGGGRGLGRRLGARAREGARRLQVDLVEDSPLRAVDPRIKLAMALGASLAVMLDLAPLLAFAGLYLAMLYWARLLPRAWQQIWRLKWVLVVLFVVDWLVVSPNLAVMVSLRIILLSGVYALVFATTLPSELRLALEWLRLPYRYVFSLTLALQSMGILEGEWRAIGEAQRARGAWEPAEGWRRLVERTRDLVALTVPAVVLAARLAWSMTEAAYARGFDAPHRRPYHALRLGSRDWWLLGATVVVVAALLIWR